jgi:hypothetical protein
MAGDIVRLLRHREKVPKRQQGESSARRGEGVLSVSRFAAFCFTPAIPRRSEGRCKDSVIP